MSQEINEDCLDLFEQSIGEGFRVKGTTIVDVIEGVDRQLMLVNGKLYGGFGVHMCELTNEGITGSVN